jgi:hypothetical protein
MSYHHIHLQLWSTLRPISHSRPFSTAVTMIARAAISARHSLQTAVRPLAAAARGYHEIVIDHYEVRIEMEPCYMRVPP